MLSFASTEARECMVSHIDSDVHHINAITAFISCRSFVQPASDADTEPCRGSLKDEIIAKVKVIRVDCHVDLNQ